jgi:hypothetical protein
LEQHTNDNYSRRSDDNIFVITFSDSNGYTFTNPNAQPRTRFNTRRYRANNKRSNRYSCNQRWCESNSLLQETQTLTYTPLLSTISSTKDESSKSKCFKPKKEEYQP